MNDLHAAVGHGCQWGKEVREVRTEVEKWVDDEGQEHSRILHIVEFSKLPSRELIELKATVINILLTLLIEGGIVGSILVVYWLLKMH